MKRDVVGATDPNNFVFDSVLGLICLHRASVISISVSRSRLFGEFPDFLHCTPGLRLMHPCLRYLSISASPTSLEFPSSLFDSLSLWDFSLNSTDLGFSILHPLPRYHSLLPHHPDRRRPKTSNSRRRLNNAPPPLHNPSRSSSPPRPPSVPRRQPFSFRLPRTFLDPPPNSNNRDRDEEEERGVRRALPPSYEVNFGGVPGIRAVL